MSKAVLKHRENGEMVTISSPELSSSGKVLWGNVVNDKDFEPGEMVGYYISDWTILEMEGATA